MPEPYRWPDNEAVRVLNERLCLPACGDEQDWEIKLADSTRLEEQLALFRSAELDLECRSALALLILHALTYHHAGPDGASAAAPAVGAAIRSDGEVLHRMRQYWSEGFLEHESAVAAILA